MHIPRILWTEQIMWKWQFQRGRRAGNRQPAMGLGAILQTMVDIVNIAHVVDITYIEYIEHLAD